MKLLSRLVLLSALLLGAAPALAQDGLQEQSTDGRYRTCVYPPSFSQRSRGGAKDRFVRIGVGEPCPSVYPGETKSTKSVIPSMATLKEESRSDGGEPMCVYAYLGREYRRPKSGAYCAMTPN